MPYVNKELEAEHSKQRWNEYKKHHITKRDALIFKQCAIKTAAENLPSEEREKIDSWMHQALLYINADVRSALKMKPDEFLELLGELGMWLARYPHSSDINEILKDK